MGGLYEQAVQVLRNNDRGGFTVPAQGLYPYQWLWDSGFNAMGWLYLDERRAWQELFSLFEGQWPDGMVPHIVFHKKQGSYFPGPEVWGTVGRGCASSVITQPPILATAVRYLYEHARDHAFARESAKALYPRILAYHRWLYQARDPNRTGLVAVVHPWATGMDNSPAWDEPLRRVPTEGVPPYERKDLLYAKPEERPRKEEYDRYLWLLYFFRRLNFDQRAIFRESPFKVIDVGFNAILHRANQDLYALAVMLGEETHEIQEWIVEAQVGFQALWDREDNFYYSLDLIAGRRIRVKTSAGFLPLFAGIPGEGRARRLAEHFREWIRHVRYALPSVHPLEPSFEGARYWRGPVWVNVNWMLAEAFWDYGYDDLAERLRNDTLELIRRSGFREYYHPKTGEGRGGKDFSWTAALALAWRLLTKDEDAPAA